MAEGPTSLTRLINPPPAYLQPHSHAIADMGLGGMSNQQLQSLSFGAIDRPACPYCGERAYLTRRSPHPVYGLTSNNCLSARLAITPLNALWPLAAILSNNWKPREITTYAATSHILRLLLPASYRARPLIS